MPEVQAKTDQAEQTEQKWHVPRSIQGLVKQASNELGEDISDTIADMCKSGFYFKPLAPGKDRMDLDDVYLGSIVDKFDYVGFNAIVAMESLNCRVFTPEENNRIFKAVCEVKHAAHPEEDYSNLRGDSPATVQRRNVVNLEVQDVKDHYANANEKVPEQFEQGGQSRLYSFIIDTIYHDRSEEYKNDILDKCKSNFTNDLNKQKEKKSLSDYGKEADKLNKDRVPVEKNDKMQGKDELSH